MRGFSFATRYVRTLCTPFSYIFILLCLSRTPSRQVTSKRDSMMLQFVRSAILSFILLLFSSFLSTIILFFFPFCFLLGPLHLKCNISKDLWNKLNYISWYIFKQILPKSFSYIRLSFFSSSFILYFYINIFSYTEDYVSISRSFFSYSILLQIDKFTFFFLSIQLRHDLQRTLLCFIS